MPAITKSPPWETFYNEVEALFEGDTDINVMRQFTEGKKQINIYVENDKKYLLLQKYLPSEKRFGAVIVFINLIPANKELKNSTTTEDMHTLFDNNKNVSVVETKGVPGGELTYVAFKNGVVQFFDDNMADLNRNKTMLMEDVARDVLNVPIDGVYFCTDMPAKSDTALNKKKPAKVEHRKITQKDLDDLFKLFEF